ILASGSLSHRFAQNGLAPEYAFKVWSPFLEQLDHEVVRMWQAGEWKAFCGMLPEYAAKGHGAGFMHDTAMLLGALGWADYDGRAEILTPYFAAPGTGQISAVFPVTPQTGDAIPKAQASSADGYANVATRLYGLPCPIASSSTPPTLSSAPTWSPCAAAWPTRCLPCAPN